MKISFRSAQLWIRLGRRCSNHVRAELARNNGRLRIMKSYRSGRWSVPQWEGGIQDVSAKGLRSWQVEAQALVLVAVVASTTIKVIATASLLYLIAVGTPMGIEGVARITVEAETFMHQDRGVRPAALLHLVD